MDTEKSPRRYRVQAKQLSEHIAIRFQITRQSDWFGGRELLADREVYTEKAVTMKR